MIQQQEAALLAAFRAVHPEDREIILGYVQARAERNAKPQLRLVETQPTKH